MTSSNNSNINVDLKLKERLKLFEEIDKMVKSDKMNPSNKELINDLSNCENISINNYSEKSNTRADEFSENNFNFPMQNNNSNKAFQNKKNNCDNIYKNSQEKPHRNLFSPGSEEENIFKKEKFINKTAVHGNANSINNFKTRETKRGNNSNSNSSIKSKKSSDRSNNKGKKLNTNITNKGSDFNNYKNLKNGEKKLPIYSSKSPQKNNWDKLSDFENNDYDYPKQININTRELKNKFYENAKPEKECNFENPFKNNISKEQKNMNKSSAQYNTEGIYSVNTNLKKKFDSNFRRESAPENVIEQKKNQPMANNIKKQIKKDFVECFDYDFYNFPLIKNIPDSKITAIKDFDKKFTNNREKIDLISKNFPIDNLQPSGYNNNNDERMNNFKNRNLNEFLTPSHKNKIHSKVIEIKNNTLKANNAELNFSNDINKSKNNNNVNDFAQHQKLFRSKSRDNFRVNKDNNNKGLIRSKSKETNKNSENLKTLKNGIIYNKDENFGNRLYNYNHYYNQKKKKILDEENKLRIRSATPKITKKAKNLNRDQARFHERLYPFMNNDNNKKDENLDLANKSNIKVNFEDNLITQNKAFQKIYDTVSEPEIDKNNFAVNNLIYLKNNNDDLSFLTTNVIGAYEQTHHKRSLSTDARISINKSKKDRIMYCVNDYNKKIFEKKTLQQKANNFMPMLNKKSLNIAERLGPASIRLNSNNRKSSKNFKIDKNQRKNNYDNNNNNSNHSNIIFSPRSNISAFSDISKHSIFNNYRNANSERKPKIKDSFPIKRQIELYEKGLEKMKIREERSRIKKQLENEYYKNFSYRPKINETLSPDSNCRIIRTPSNLQKEETLKLDLSENNLLHLTKDKSSHHVDEHNSIEHNLNNQNFLDNKDYKSNISDIEKFKHIYEKNLMWQKKVETHKEIIKTHQDKKINNNLTFKPLINKAEMRNDERFIEKNIDQIQTYVNKRRANIKKQKQEEDLKQRKFSYGKNYIIKPTIPKEFNLSTANRSKSRSSTKINNNSNNKLKSFDSAYMPSNITQVQSESNANQRTYINNNFIRRDNTSNDNTKVINRYNTNPVSEINKLRSELKIEGFFYPNENRILKDSQECEIENTNYNNELFYTNENYNVNNHKNDQISYSHGNINKPQNQQIFFTLQNENNYNNNNLTYNINNPDQINLHTYENNRFNHNERNNNFSNLQTNKKSQNSYYPNHQSIQNSQIPNYTKINDPDNLEKHFCGNFQNMNQQSQHDNRQYQFYGQNINNNFMENKVIIQDNYNANNLPNKNYYGNHQMKNFNYNNNQNNNFPKEDQAAFLNAISNLHEKLSNLNI